MKVKLYAFFYIIGYLVIAGACNKKNDYNTNVDVVKEWNFNLSSSNENFVTPGAETNATFHMVVLGDNSIRYDVKVDSAADRIVTAEIRLGDPVSEGALLLNLPVRIYSTYASGVLTGLSSTVIETLLNNNIEKYINITSEKAPSGLVRGQLNADLILSENVALSGTAVVPSVTTTTSGTAFLRLSSKNVLYSKVVINNNDPADPVTTATINQGISTANGPVVVNLASSASDFGVGKTSAVSPAVASTLVSNNTYVTVNSALRTGGKLRGQIR